jgi:predicted lipoprotein
MWAAATYRSWLAASVLSALAIAGCGGGGGGGSTPDAWQEDPTGDGGSGFTRRALLERVTTQFLIPTYERFATEADELVTAIDAYCAAPAAETRAAAQSAWREAIDVWQRVNALSVGPVEMSDSLGTRIYSWPLLSTCQVDTDTAARWKNPASYDVNVRFDNARSLTAVEYLLFIGVGANHTCASAPMFWSEAVFDLERARCGLAAAIAADVAAQADKVVTAWKPEGGNYVAQLVEAGTAQSAIGSAQDAVNLISDSLFFVDRMVKDMKLSETAGIGPNSCGAVGTPCLDEVEHRVSDHAQPAIVLNLEALRVGFTGTIDGGEGPGFDDFLREVGHPEVADRMTTNLDAAIAAAKAMPPSFLGALASNRDSVVATHTAVKAFTDDLKMQFLTLLGLDIPDDIATDND